MRPYHLQPEAQGDLAVEVGYTQRPLSSLCRVKYRAITVFTVPNPNCSSQNQSVFSGLAAPQVAPLG